MRGILVEFFRASKQELELDGNDTRGEMCCCEVVIGQCKPAE
jgi:hypothetical protein